MRAAQKRGPQLSVPLSTFPIAKDLPRSAWVTYLVYWAFWKKYIRAGGKKKKKRKDDLFKLTFNRQEIEAMRKK